MEKGTFPNKLILAFPNFQNNPIYSYKNPSDMSVNRLVAGIENDVAVREASIQEIARRKMRYKKEIELDIERSSTLHHLGSNIKI